MERNFAQEIDEIKRELAELKQLLTGKPTMNDGAEKVGHVHQIDMHHPDAELNARMVRLQQECGKSGQSGLITYMGVFTSGGRQSNWIRSAVSTDDLLPLIENRTAEQVLACIGSNDRLNLLLAILRKPRTVAELVSDCGFSSTGQVYHHLKPLIAADLVFEDSENEGKGRYAIRPHRVQGLIMLLAGICDMVDTTYTQGNFQQESMRKHFRR
ncbi:MAG: helix-turn-helix transcriptional regulator [Clostridia bacterium]|nr:helix-turn-helix transcriptional regulator [Clostridia bacterium]